MPVKRIIEVEVVEIEGGFYQGALSYDKTPPEERKPGVAPIPPKRLRVVEKGDFHTSTRIFDRGDAMDPSLLFPLCREHKVLLFGGYVYLEL